MPRLSTTVAFALILAIGLQMAVCLASGDCIRLRTGRSAVSADSVSDCDGCGCCHPHIGFRFAALLQPSAAVEFVQPPQQAALHAEARPVPYFPPRS